MEGNLQQPPGKPRTILASLANLALILLCLTSIWLLFKNGYSWYYMILPRVAFLLNSWYFIIVPIIALLLIGGYTSGWFKWTGLQGYDKNTIATEEAITVSPSVSTPEKKTTTIERIPRKTLWDWMQLLLVPIMLTLIAFAFNAQLNYTNQMNSDQQQKQALILNNQQYQENQKLALDQQRETILENYLNNISDLLLNNNLHTSKRLDEVRTVARIKTLTALERLDPGRKRIIILFLFEADLIGINNPNITINKADNPIIALSLSNLRSIDLSGLYLYGADIHNTYMNGANLEGAVLSYCNLSISYLNGANLHNANLHKANLYHSDLSGADLSGADLSGADVTIGQLSKAKTLKGATMPDGTIHP